MMNPQSQGANSSVDLPMKRRRGRPRKDESLGTGENMLPVAGNDIVGENKEAMVVSNAAYGGMVGQVVYGIIEGSFDGGYLLKVKVGDSDTYLRGVAFLPSQFTPITPANDVAPQVKMIKRTEIPFPSSPTQLQVTAPLSEQNDMQSHTLDNSMLISADKGRLLKPHTEIPITQENQSSVVSLTENLPVTSLEPASKNQVTTQLILDSRTDTLASSILDQAGNGKVSGQEKVLQELKAANEQALLASQSSTPHKVLPGSSNNYIDLHNQNQGGVSCELNLNQLVREGIRSPNPENNQIPSIVDIPVVQQTSEKVAAMPEFVKHPVCQLKESNPDKKHANQPIITNNTNAMSAPAASLPATVFERDTAPLENKISGEEPHLRMLIEPPQFCHPSGTTMLKPDTNSTPLTGLNISLFEKEPIPSEPKNDSSAAPVLSSFSESQFCSSLGGAKNNTIRPTET